jgi:hypothetical protein
VLGLHGGVSSATVDISIGRLPLCFFFFTVGWYPCSGVSERLQIGRVGVLSLVDYWPGRKEAGGL